jgi:predicted dehydrogenase
MSERVFQVGIIGLGGMGHQHTLTCHEMPNVQVVAGCDVMESQRTRWQERFGFPDEAVFESYHDMLSAHRLDAVIVATQADVHRDPVVDAAAQGVHVFCEKPLALDLVEADDMVAACEAAGVKLAVNHIKRGSRGSEIAQKLIDDGEIGEVYLVRGEAKGRRWAGSELMEMGTHLFDWLRFLFGDPAWLFSDMVQGGRPAGPEDIVHSLNLPYPERDCGLVLGQRAFCSLSLPNGIHADIGFLNQPTGEDYGYGFDIVGTAGTLALRRSVGSTLYIQRHDHRGPMIAPDWEEIPVDEWAGLPEGLGGTTRDPEARIACQYRLLQEFFAAIVEDREPKPSGRDGRSALELVMAVWQSQREGKPVTFPLPARTHPLQDWLAATPAAV